MSGLNASPSERARMTECRKMAGWVTFVCLSCSSVPANMISVIGNPKISLARSNSSLASGNVVVKVLAHSDELGALTREYECVHSFLQLVYGPKGNHFYRNSRKAIPSAATRTIRPRLRLADAKESRSVKQSEIERKRCLSLRPTEEAPPRRPVPFQTRRLPRINRRNTGPTTADENPPSLSDTNGPAGGAGRNTSGLLPHIITELHEFEGGSILPRTEHVRDRSFYIRRISACSHNI